MKLTQEIKDLIGEQLAYIATVDENGKAFILPAIKLVGMVLLLTLKFTSDIFPPLRLIFRTNLLLVLD